MLEHLATDQIKSYRDRTMLPEDLLAADKHFAECAECREQLGGAGKLGQPLASLQESLRAARASPEHLSYDTLEAYVNAEADDLEREIVASHIELCKACERELSELRDFAATIASEPVAQQESLPLWKRLLAMKGQPADRMLFRVLMSSAAAMLVVAVGVLVLFVYQKRESLPLDTAQMNRSLPGNKDKLTAIANANIAVANANMAAPPHNKNIEPEPKQDSVIASIVLKPTLVREGGKPNSLVIPPNADSVRMLAGVEGSKYESYQAKLQTLEGKAVWNGILRAEQAGSGRRVVVTLPAKLFEDGGYLLSLGGITRRGNTEQAGEYILRVIKK